MTYYLKNSGTICFTLCFLVFSFTCASNSDNRYLIDIPHILLPTLPIYLVLAITGILLGMILITGKKFVIDSVAIVLFLRMVLPFIPIFFFDMSTHFWINYCTTALCCIYYIFSYSYAQDQVLIKHVFVLFLIIISAQTILEVVLGPYDYLDNTYFYKNDLTIPIGSSNSIVPKILPFFAFLMCVEEKKFFKCLYCLDIILVIALTKSRGGIIGLLLILIIVNLWDSKISFKQILLFLFSLSILLTSLYLFVNYSEIGKNVFSTNNSTVLERISLWKYGFNVFLESPLFGVGFSSEMVDENPHNFVVSILMRSGLIGISILIYLIYVFYKSIKKHTNDKYVRGYVSFSLALILHSLVEIVLFSYIPDMMIWFSLGAMKGYIRNIDKTEEDY